MEKTQNIDTAALLKQASAIPQGVILEESNPLDNVPDLAVGKDILKGQVIAGYYVETRTIESKEFKYARKTNPTTGMPQQDLHVLRLTSGALIGIWSVGELGLFFSKRTQGEFVKLTYNGKGTNEKGQSQHFLAFEVGRTAN